MVARRTSINTYQTCPLSTQQKYGNDMILGFTVYANSLVTLLSPSMLFEAVAYVETVVVVSDTLLIMGRQAP